MPPPDPGFLRIDLHGSAPVLSLLLFLVGCGQASFRCDPGVVLMQVQPGGAAERAGLHMGDVLLGWRGETGLDGAEPARGDLAHVFQLTWLEEEQAPRGKVTLTGTSNGKPFEKTLPIGAWGLKARPNFKGSGQRIWRRAQAALEEKDSVRAHEHMKALAVLAGQSGEQAIACWLYLRSAGVTGEEQVLEAAFEPAHESARFLADKRASAQVWREFAEALGAANDWAGARVAYEHALASLQGDETAPLIVATLHDKLGIVAVRLRDPEAAGHHFTTTLALRQQHAPNSLALADILSHLGNLANFKSEFDVAARYYSQALTVARDRQPDSELVYKILVNLGVCNANIGKLALAEKFYQESLAIAEGLKTEPGSLLRVLINLGNVANNRKDFESAQDYYLRARKMAEEKRHTDFLATLANNLGTLAGELGEDQEAYDHYREAIEIRRSLSEDSKQEADYTNNMGFALQKLDDFDGALASHRAARAIYDQLEIRDLQYAFTLEQLAKVYHRKGETNRAAELFDEAETLCAELLPRSFDMARILNSKGLFLRDQGQPKQATASFKQALAALEHQIEILGGSKNQQMNFQADYADFYRDLAETYIELEQPDEAMRVVEDFRARYFRYMLASSKLTGGTLPDRLEAERNRLDEAYRKAQNTLGNGQRNDTRDLRSLREQRDRLQDRIREQASRKEAFENPPPLTTEQIRNVLDPGTLLLSYLVCREQSYLFALAADAEGPPRIFPLELGDRVLRNHVTGFRKALQRPGEDATAMAALNERARGLYKYLVAPATALIERAERLLIIPDGPLHSLPFGALVRNDPAKRVYLAELKPLFFDVSATVHEQALRTRTNRSSLRNLVAFGDPDYSSHFPALAASREEVRWIAPHFVQQNLFLGKQATEAHAKQLGEEADYLHFATHGMFNEAAPMDSWLLFSLDGQAEEDGYLQAWEVLDMRLDCALVTLSGCSTALGREMGNEGLIGLTRAFRFAGAHSVLASLFDVKDAATAKLMARFYHHLAEGKTKDRALQAAQAEMVASESNGHPRNWAGFCLFGDWR